jgi:hypothetical protein
LQGGRVANGNGKLEGPQKGLSRRVMKRATFMEGPYPLDILSFYSSKFDSINNE